MHDRCAYEFHRTGLSGCECEVLCISCSKAVQQAASTKQDVAAEAQDALCFAMRTFWSFCGFSVLLAAPGCARM